MIYEPFSDEGYESVVPTTIEDIDRLAAFDGSPLRAGWRPISVERVTVSERGQRLLDADFPGATLALIARKRAIDSLRFLVPHVEFLPLKVSDSTELFVFNVLNVVDALDEQYSDIVRFESGRIMHIRHAVFRPQLLSGADIFRLPSFGRTYVSHRFVRAIADAGLTGLVFEQVWDGRVR